MSRDSSITIAMAGDDMSPAIEVGERLLVEPVNPNDVRLGDVIVFKRYVLIAHRVVGIMRHHSGYYFITHGDRCAYVDSPVHQGLVIGRIPSKLIPLRVSIRSKVLFAMLLLWYMQASKIFYGRTFRRLNGVARRVASLCL